MDSTACRLNQMKETSTSMGFLRRNFKVKNLVKHFFVEAVGREKRVREWCVFLNGNSIVSATIAWLHSSSYSTGAQNVFRRNFPFEEFSFENVAPRNLANILMRSRLAVFRWHLGTIKIRHPLCEGKLDDTCKWMSWVEIDEILCSRHATTRRRLSWLFARGSHYTNLKLLPGIKFNFNLRGSFNNFVTFRAFIQLLH